MIRHPRRPAGLATAPARSGAPATAHYGEAIWLHGAHAVLAAVANPQRRCHRLLALPESHDRLAAAAAAAPRPRPAVEPVDRAALRSVLSADAVHQGMAVLVDPLPTPAIEEVLSGEANTATAILVVLDQVSDPRNLGAVLRAAAAFSATAVIVQDRHSPPAAGALAKAASGALESVPLIRVGNVARALRSVQAAGHWCVGFDATAGAALAEADLSGRITLVFGSEGRGLRRLVRDSCDTTVRIPMAPSMESLNVATAVAIALYEVARSRHR
jgi:23S rRNA (guanosine2251-2'-O)-methyltransferase